jgi:pyruvate kinase
MLSGETASGAYPINAVQIMAKLCYEAEQCISYNDLYDKITKFTPTPVAQQEAVCSSAVMTADKIVNNNI